MKKVVSVTEVPDEGLVSLLGKKVIVLCMNYIYTGDLEGVNDSRIALKNPSLVYETGAWSDKKFADAQKLPHTLYVQTAAIESFGETDKA